MARGRQRKVGLTRMDAAIDALTPLGFSKRSIKHTVNSLLEVYEGDAGWVFIEEACYKLVIETILEEQEKEFVMKEVQDNAETSAAAAMPEIAEQEEIKEVSEAAGTIPKVLGDEPTEGINNADSIKCSSVADNRLNWKDFSCMDHDHHQKQINISNLALSDNRGGNVSSDQPETGRKLGASESGPTYLQPVDGSLQSGRRKPCYGWIGSEANDDEEDFVLLDTVSSFKSKMTKEQKRERKTRWDVKPDNV